MSALLYGRINNPDWKIPWHDTAALSAFFGIEASFEYGRSEPLGTLFILTRIYMCLADDTIKETQKRAENALYIMVKAGMGVEFIDRLPLGIAAPLREATRTCQLSPPAQWPTEAYRIIGRNDLAAGVSHAPDMLFNDGYKPMKDFIVSIGWYVFSRGLFDFRARRPHRLENLSVPSSLRHVWQVVVK